VRARHLDTGGDRLRPRALVLVKGGAHLEQAAAVRAVAFDKTGTLTLGRPRVETVEPVDGAVDAAELLRLAASLESGSEHPLARAIVREARSRGLPVGGVEGFEALPGLGARGRVEGVPVAIGDPRLVDGAIGPDVRASLERLRALGQTAVVVLRDGQPIGSLGITDTLRPEAAAAVSSLTRLGIDPVVLLTGDNGSTAAAIATEVGIAEVRAGLLPEDKATAVSDLPGPLAMVGDGVNDAPALAAASLGVAMGTAGSDTAIEVADVAIMGDDPRKVAGLIGLARWTKGIVRQNIVFSLGTKALAAAILAAGALPLWGAVVADVGASLVVVGNGLRLVRGRPGGALRGMPLLEPAARTPADRDANAAAATDTDGCCDHGSARASRARG
jgi:Cd2+/Zn2+-exporting ATPase